jgi:N-acetylmuramoyl-L-alanine amidase
MRLTEEVSDSNSKRPAAHVALHSNAAQGLSRGQEVYVHRFGGNAEALGRKIYEYNEAVSPAPGLGVKEGANTFGGRGMYELKATSAPAVLIEYAFHDNPEDSQFIIDNIYELGNATARGVLEYLGVPYREDTPENTAFLKSKYNSQYV